MNKTQKVSGSLLSVLLTVLVVSLLTISTGCPGSDDPTDPCEGVTCKNGGDCNDNGDCNCPPNYEGSDCGIEKLPTRVDVDKIVVTAFPQFKEDGTPWDNVAGTLGQRPELKARVWAQNTAGNWEVLKYVSTTIHSHAEHGQNYSFTVGTLSLDKPLEKYRVSLYDLDDDAQPFPDDGDFMGAVNFTPYVSGQNFPTPILLSGDGGKIKFEVHVKYIP